jgi:hypothetical protein
MKRTLAATMLLLVLAPAAALVAMGMPGCCAGGDDRLMAPMACCQTSMCDDPSPAKLSKANAVVVPTLEASADLLDRVIPPGEKLQAVQAAVSPPVRIRLALISTLLI